MKETFPKKENIGEEKERVENLTGIDFVFSENPHIKELALKYADNDLEKAKEIYSEYIETIFPDSELENIVYHGSNRGDIEKFEINRDDNKTRMMLGLGGEDSKGIYFADGKNGALSYGSKLYSCLLNSKKMVVNLNATAYEAITGKELHLGDVVNLNDNFYASHYETFANINDEIREKYNSPDTFYAAGDGESTASESEMIDLYNEFQKLESSEEKIKFFKENYKSYGAGEIIVFDPNQIHILGSKKDEEMFKQYLEKNFSK